MGEPVRCPVCDEPASPGERQVRSFVYVFCCEGCAPKVRETFDDDRDARDGRDRRGPEAA